MSDSLRASALTFHETSFDPIEHSSGETWLRHRQIADALGYSKPGNLIDLFNANATEFNDSMTALVKLPTAGGVQEVRIFSLRGAHLLGMFARTERAAEFRRWVLDVLEQQHASVPTTPVTPALLAPTFERVVAERDALRGMLAQRVLREEPQLRAALYYYSIEGLTHRERAKLVGWKSTDAYLAALRRLAALGLVEYQPNERLQENGRRAYKHMQAVLANGPVPQANGFPPGHPQRARPACGRNAAGMAVMRGQRGKGKAKA